ncbi:MAG: hypothetical protein WCH34_18480, partial [Bacteroidota bacterium]
MKKVVLFILILLGFIKVSYCQVATISTVFGTYGTTQVNVNLLNFTNHDSIGAITMKIGFDTNVVSFTGITYALIPSGISTNVIGNELQIAWFSTPAVPVNGIGFKLNFTYTGGTSNLTFNSGCEIARALGGIIPVTFNNGAILQPTLTTTAVIGSQAGVYSGINLLPITFSGFPTTPTASLAGNINLHIAYNTNNLQFIGISGLTNATANASNGIISISWSNATPINVNTLSLKLKFYYLGGTTTVSFTGTNIISNAHNVQIPVNTSTNGGFTQPATTAVVDIGDTLGQLSGTTAVPITFSNFPINQGTFTMNIAYNNSALNFIGTSGLTGLNSNASNGIINLTWTNSNGFYIPGFNLLFNYVSGASTLVFTGVNQITNNTNVIIPTTFTNGSVSQPPIPVNISLGNVSQVSGNNNISVPITLSAVSGYINTANMYINYDTTKLIYSGTENVSKSGVTITQDLTTKTLSIHWADANTFNSLGNGKFLDLKFIINSAIGNCDLPVYFTTFNSNTSSLLDNLGGTVYSNWVNGNVNVTPAAPTGTSSQSFCSGMVPLVTNLVANGTSIKWYAASSGGTALATSTALVNGNHYFASQTVNGCESSTRFDVTATVNTTPLTPTGNASQSFCSGTNPTISNLLANGNSIQWYAASIGGTALATSTALVNGNHYFASQTVNGCESSIRFDVTATVNTTPLAPSGNASQSFCSGANPTISNLLVSGTSIQWYAASNGGTALATSTALVNGNHYFASQTVNGCESSTRF